MAQQMSLYNLLNYSIANAEVSFVSHKFKVMLVSSGYIPSNSHRYKSDITGEITGAGYSAGGADVTDTTFSTVDNVGTFRGNNPVWTGLTNNNIRWGILYDDTPTSDSTKPLIGYIDFTDTLSFINTNFQIIWNQNGILTLTINNPTG